MLVEEEQGCGVGGERIVAKKAVFGRANERKGVLLK